MTDAVRKRFGNVILCEHAVKGENNKHTLVGIFSGDVIVSAFPARLFFGLYIEHFAELNDPPIYLEIRLEGAAFAGLDLEPTQTKPGAPAIIMIPMFELGADKPITLDVISIENRGSPSQTEHVVLSKRIIAGDITASAERRRPAARFQPGAPE